MSDVARLAGVGTMTVSRVLNGTAHVAEETALRVQTAIDRLRYRPNELARAFRCHRSRSIGLILPYLYDSFFANCAHAVTTVAKERGYSVIITTSNEDPDTEYDEAEQMLRWNVDGLVVIPARFRRSRLTRALFGKTPVVAFDRPVADPAFDVVLVRKHRRRPPHGPASHRAWASAHRLYGTEPQPVYHQRPISRLSPCDARCGPQRECILRLRLPAGHLASR